MSVNPDKSAGQASASPESVDSDYFKVRVARKETLAGGIHLFELHHPEGADLPAFTAGAHLTVKVPNGSRRNYSLCSNPAEKSLYQIAVKRDTGGRGGSLSMVDDVHEGDLLNISAPRNNFELHPRANKFLFVAGGIGITPVLSMMRHLKAQGGAEFRLIYCTRDAESTAFLSELTGPEFGKHVQVHHDHGDIENALDFWPVFESPTNTHVYCCGPRGLMDAVADMSGHWPSGSMQAPTPAILLLRCACKRPGKPWLWPRTSPFSKPFAAPGCACPAHVKAAPAALAAQPCLRARPNTATWCSAMKKKQATSWFAFPAPHRPNLCSTYDPGLR